MTLQELKTKFGIQSIEFKKWKEDGAFMATIINPANGLSIQLFTTKATGNKFNLKSEVTVYDNVFYVGIIKEALETKTL